MSGNPFDQFAGSLQAALPPDDGTVATQQTQQQQQQQFNLMAQPAPEKKPVMNTGMLMGMPPQQQQQGGMYGAPAQGMYGQQPPQQQGQLVGMYGQQQQQQPPPPQQNMMMPTSSIMGAGFGGSMNNNGAAPQQPPPPMQQLTNNTQMPGTTNNVMAGALVPSNTQSNPYALGPTGGASVANPFGATPTSAPATQQQQQLATMGGGGGGSVANPFGAPAPTPPQANGGIMAMDPFSAAPQQQQQQMVADPWGSQPNIQQPPAPQLAADPFGGGGAPPATSNAMVPSSAPPSNDPFGVFGGGGQPPPAGPFSSGASVAAQSFAGGSAVGAPPSVSAYNNDPTQQQQQQFQQQQYQQQQPQPPAPAADDPWAEMGFGSPAPAPPPTSGPVPGEDDDLFNTGLQPTRDESKSSESKPPPSDASSKPTSPSSGGKRKKGELPPGGEWYDAKIFTPTLGVMFFKPKELVDSLFLQTDKKMVEQLDERPVVAFIVEGSSARSAGVELGHVLLKVNGIDVKNPKEASRLIKEGPRPLPLLFYVPETNIVVAEGEHMVKYNTKETGAPNSAKDWKPKYVVIGGIIAQPWMMNMYRSKSEYDIAVIETQARRPVSVKVKQFSLQGARIQNDWQGPQMVKYKNKLHPWKYIVILPISRNPIKIASPNLSQLKPVHEGIRRVLQAQQRDRGGGGRNAGPVRGQNDPYNSRNGGGGGGYDTRGRNGGRSDHY